MVQTKSQKYSKKDPVEHMKLRPDMYIGSNELRETEEYVVTDEKFSIEKRKITISPGIVRIFVEPLSNAIDNVAESKEAKIKMTKIMVNIDKDTGETTIWNDGYCIPIEMHESEGCYIHTMIFGELLTGSKYDDDKDRIDISGKNGLGIKCTNVFSDKFTVEAKDPNNKKAFSQTWRGNMKVKEEPIVTKIKKSECKAGYTKITYIPDFKFFGLEGYTDDIISLYKRLVTDAAMVTKLDVYYNDELIPVKNLVEYTKLYNKNREEENNDEDNEEKDEKDEKDDDKEGDNDKGKPKNILNIKTKTAEVVLIPSSSFQSIAFVNGIFTPKGTHVDAWCEALFRPLLQKINKPKKPQLNMGDIKNFFHIFLTISVNKPAWDSQSKLLLESPKVSDIETDVKKTHISTLMKWNILDQLEDIIRAKEMIGLKKTERKKRSYTRVEGLDPANNEGGKHGRECTLILVEGLSAKTYAVSGINRGLFGKCGRDWNGILALRGKILNTRNAKVETIKANKVITEINHSLGVQYDTDYTIDSNYQKLRYGKIMIITDADTDGFHITGLIQNVFHSLFPSLLKRETPFLYAMQTPIVRVFLGKNDLLFYDEREYHNFVKKWSETHGDKKIQKKYYKGLGSSSPEDVQETFGQKIVEFYQDEKTFDTMLKAFHTKYSDQRKEWMAKYDPERIVLKWNSEEQEQVKLSIADFIDTEMIKFSIEDCKRSIPNIMDGLKEGQRKILYVALLRNLKYSGKELKLAQFGSSVGELADYHHGENNLFLTTVGLAQSFVGSNNIPLFARGGQFGTRLEGGKDSAQPRYIFTKMDALTRIIFAKNDDDLLTYRETDGIAVEPYFYTPILPMILVNGCLGIGTGWSSVVPCHNPLDLIECIKIWLENDGNVFTKDDNDNTTISLFPEIKPWYRGFNGEITLESDRKYITKGVLEKKGNKTHVSELPIGYWTNDFKDYLEKLKEEKEIKDYKNHSTENVVDFTIVQNDDGMDCNIENLKLYTYIRTTNIVLFDHNNKLKKYSCIDEVIDDFCKVRYEFYIKRKQHLLKELEQMLRLLGNKKRFLEEIRDQKIVLFSEDKGKKTSRKTVDITRELEERGYDKVYKEDKKEKEEDDDEENGEEEKDEKKKGHGYEYLLQQRIQNITEEKINKLQNDIMKYDKDREDLANTSEKQLWLRDLDEFRSAYIPYIKSLEVKDKSKKVGKKNGKKNK